MRFRRIYYMTLQLGFLELLRRDGPFDEQEIGRISFDATKKIENILGSKISKAHLLLSQNLMTLFWLEYFCVFITI